jgi:acetate CoA/acetoacetate CoA-transferase beta subunit
MMKHCNKHERSKILDNCSFPLTAKGQVNLIITDLAVIEVVQNGLLLREVAPHSSIEEVIEKTATELIIAQNV